MIRSVAITAVAQPLMIATTAVAAAICGPACRDALRIATGVARGT